MSTIRALRETDWPAVADIFGQGIATGDATFETAVPDWAEFDASRHPLLRLVATTSGDDVVGWAAASPVSARPVYRGVVEHSVYVADAAQGRGVGRELLSTLVELAELCGVWTLRSGIFPENAASLAVHGQCGFRELGRHRRLGFGNGRWRDVVLVERRSLAVGTARPFLRTATPPIDSAESHAVQVLLRDNGLPPEGLDAAWLTLLADAEVTSGLSCPMPLPPRPAKGRLPRLGPGVAPPLISVQPAPGAAPPRRRPGPALRPSSGPPCR